jgi:hypothetical protein
VVWVDTSLLHSFRVAQLLYQRQSMFVLETSLHRQALVTSTWCLSHPHMLRIQRCTAILIPCSS